jgi:transcriptional regulator with XRE-family HTH domain
MPRGVVRCQAGPLTLRSWKRFPHSPGITQRESERRGWFATVALMETPRQDGGATRTITAVIAERMRTLRDEARLSGPALATAMSKLGIPWNRTTVAKLETGRRESVSVRELLALALVLDVPPISLLADPKSNDLIPVAEGVEVGPWDALLWLSGAGTLDTRPDHAAYQATADLIWEGRLVAEMDTNLRRIPRFMGTKDDAQRSLNDLHRTHLETMRGALERIQAMGATLPRLGPHVLARAAELGVKLPGQEDQR